MLNVHYNLPDMAYAVVFAGLSFGFVSNDFSNRRHWSYPSLAIISYFLMSIGNVIYAFGVSQKYIFYPWKILAPYFVFYFIFSGVQDQTGGTTTKYKARLSKTEWAAINAGSWILGVAIFVPAFRANLKLAGLWPFF